MEKTQTLGCVVMAAGNASRFGANKLTVPLQGKSMICRALDAVPGSAFDQVVVVSQYPEILTLAEEYGFSPLRNDRPEDGLSRTIRLGLDALRRCDGVLFLVSDQPLLRRESVEGLIALWKQQPEHIAALGHNGIRGNPCLFPRRFYPELMELRGDRGGAAVIRQHESELTVLETDPAELFDVDTARALETLEGR